MLFILMQAIAISVLALLIALIKYRIHCCSLEPEQLL